MHGLVTLFLLAAAGAASLPGLPDTLIIRDWLVCGPFSVGAREGTTGIEFDTAGFQPRVGDEVPSFIAPDARVRWRPATADSVGTLTLTFENIGWDTLQDLWGHAGVMTAGYAYAEFEHSGAVRALAWCRQAGSFMLNGRSYPGDAYGDGYVQVPVTVRDGRNTILVRTSGYGDQDFTFKLLPCPEPFFLVERDATLPDVIRGMPLDAWGALPVMNATDQWLEDARLVVGDGSVFTVVEQPVPPVAPGSVLKVPFALRTTGPVTADSVRLPVRLVSTQGGDGAVLVPRVRTPDQSFRRTFISAIDSSCQYYAILPPVNYDPRRSYGLILTLHGAGVEAQGQVDAYAPKEWAFVVAPTNRRRFGFDWQDWGRLDALEVLAHAQQSLPIDTLRVWLTGHSMGGHGTWHVGLAHADRFGALAPSAGWTTHPLYVPWFLQKSALFAEPSALALRDRVLREDATPLFLTNAYRTPIFIMQGGSDDNVPPYQARLMASLLAGSGIEHVYREVPGKGHWWSEPGMKSAACVDDPDLIEFLRLRPRTPMPRSFTFRTTDLGQTHRLYWAEIDAQDVPYQDSWISLCAESTLVSVHTDNVQAFTLHVTRDLVRPGPVRFIVNGPMTKLVVKPPVSLSFHRSGSLFVPGPRPTRGLVKTPTHWGPLKQAYFSPFLLVYGTRGDSAATARSLHQARLQALAWWARANGLTRIVPDTLVTDELASRYNLVVLGGPAVNSFTRRVNRWLPIRVDSGDVRLGRGWARMSAGTIWLGNRPLERSRAYELIYPNPIAPHRFVAVFGARTADDEKLAGAFGTLFSGAGVPDFVIYHGGVRTRAWGGVTAAGFFDQNWKLDRTLLYLGD